MSSGEKEGSDARARQELAAIVQVDTRATISLLQRWRLGDPIALEAMQALARKGTQVTHTGGEPEAASLVAACRAECLNQI